MQGNFCWNNRISSKFMDQVLWHPNQPWVQWVVLMLPSHDTLLQICDRVYFSFLEWWHISCLFFVPNYHFRSGQDHWDWDCCTMTIEENVWSGIQTAMVKTYMDINLFLIIGCVYSPGLRSEWTPFLGLAPFLLTYKESLAQISEFIKNISPKLWLARIGLFVTYIYSVLQNQKR